MVEVHAVKRLSQFSATVTVHVDNNINYVDNNINTISPLCQHVVEVHAVRRLSQFSATVTVQVGDVNEFPPAFPMTSYHTSVTEENDRHLPLTVLTVSFCVFVTYRAFRVVVRSSFVFSSSSCDWLKYFT